jgi:tRNA-dihydrouridine synthase B
MTTSDARLWHTRRSRSRRDHDGETGPVAVQIAGADPAWMADAARFNVDHGAQIVDINMGCPAKKVCNVAAGSALLRDTSLVARIVDAVVRAVDVPVTLKIRTGWDPASRNALEVARIAQDSGIAALAVHGRTRCDFYTGRAEHDTVAQVKAAVSIPVVANGDIDSPEAARDVLARTQADAVMIGRAAQGRPWLFREIDHFLQTGRRLPPPTLDDLRDIVLGHVDALHAFHGPQAGARIARKHVGWYAASIPDGAALRAVINAQDDAALQRAAIERHFDAALDRAARGARAPFPDPALEAA